MTKQKRIDIPKIVKDLVVEIEPSAEMFLYGSHCRGDCKNGKDWDFLVLLDGEVDSARADRVRHRLYELANDVGQELKIVIKNKDEWNDPKYKNVPLNERIRREGINL